MTPRLAALLCVLCTLCAWCSAATFDGSADMYDVGPLPADLRGNVWGQSPGVMQAQDEAAGPNPNAHEAGEVEVAPAVRLSPDQAKRLPYLHLQTHWHGSLLGKGYLPGPSSRTHGVMKPYGGWFHKQPSAELLGIPGESPFAPMNHPRPNPLKGGTPAEGNGSARLMHASVPIVTRVTHVDADTGRVLYDSATPRPDGTGQGADGFGATGAADPFFHDIDGVVKDVESDNDASSEDKEKTVPDVPQSVIDAGLATLKADPFMKPA